MRCLINQAVLWRRSSVIFVVGRLKMRKLAQVILVTLGLAVLIAAGALLHRSPDHGRSPSTVATAPQALWKHDWTVRIGSRTYGVCQSIGGTWELYLGSGCIDTATSVRFQQVATTLALLGAALMLSISAVALLRLRKMRGPTRSLHSTPQ